MSGQHTAHPAQQVDSILCAPQCQNASNDGGSRPQASEHASSSRNSASKAESRQQQKNSALLKEARELAIAQNKYSPVETRERIIEATRARCDGNTPYEWQLDIAEALYLGLDSVIIAGTGAGKTLPFGLTLLGDRTHQSKKIGRAHV